VTDTIRAYSSGYDSLSDEIATVKEAGPKPYIVLVDMQPEAEKALRQYTSGQLSLPTVEKSEINFRDFLFKALRHPETFGAVSAGISDSTRLAIVKALHSQVANLVKKLDSVGSRIGNSAAVTAADKSYQRFFRLVLGGYFQNLNTETKLNMISHLLDSPGDGSEMERFGSMVMDAGPQFQKLFQVYARQDVFSPELSEVFKKLEQNTRPVPFRLIKAKIDAQPVPFQWLSVKEKPLGVGTMAQVHRARIRLRSGEEKDVVVRVMKPNIRERVLQDTVIMKKITPVIDADPELRSEGFPQLSPFVQEVEEMATAEVDQDRTIRNQIRGAQTYNRDMRLGSQRLRLHVPEIYDLGPGAQIMVQEFIPGTSFDDFASKNPRQATLAIEMVVEVWMENTLFGNGFFHSDLHQGNIRVSQGKDGTIQFNILDFGMVGQLSQEFQAKFLAAAAVLATNDPEYISRALWELSREDLNAIGRAQLKSVLENELRSRRARGKEDPTMVEWISLGINSGLRFPAEFTSLNRGMVLMYRLLSDQKATDATMKIMKSLALRHPRKMLEAVHSLKSVSTTDWAKIAMKSWENHALMKTELEPAVHSGGRCQPLFAN
jgi:predicted unusual protein kinase regulating ubiquinone biosynthesis (AarF/ABC1/UbiB family)